MNDLDVTVIIPTRNRPEFVNRALDFYAGMPWHTLVADTSDGDETRQVVYDHPGVEYVAYRDLIVDGRSDVHQVVRRALELVRTEYVYDVADDDVVMPSGMVAMALALDDGAEMAQAHQIAFALDGAPYGTLSAVLEMPYAKEMLASDDADTRMRGYLQNPNSIRPLMRAEMRKNLGRKLLRLPRLGYVYGELLPHLLMAHAAPMVFTEGVGQFFFLNPEAKHGEEALLTLCERTFHRDLEAIPDIGNVMEDIIRAMCKKAVAQEQMLTAEWFNEPVALNPESPHYADLLILQEICSEGVYA